MVFAPSQPRKSPCTMLWATYLSLYSPTHSGEEPKIEGFAGEVRHLSSVKRDRPRFVLRAPVFLHRNLHRRSRFNTVDGVDKRRRLTIKSKIVDGIGADHHRGIVHIAGQFHHRLGQRKRIDLDGRPGRKVHLLRKGEPAVLLEVLLDQSHHHKIPGELIPQRHRVGERAVMQIVAASRLRYIYSLRMKIHLSPSPCPFPIGGEGRGEGVFSPVTSIFPLYLYPVHIHRCTRHSGLNAERRRRPGNTTRREDCQQGRSPHQ